MIAARGLLALLLVLLWSALGGALSRAALMEGWRFDIADAAHWRYLGQGLEAVWTRGASMRWTFLFALVALAAAWLAIAGALARGSFGLADERLAAFGRAGLTLLRWALTPVKWVLGLFGALLVRFAGRPAPIAAPPPPPVQEVPRGPTGTEQEAWKGDAPTGIEQEAWRPKTAPPPAPLVLGLVNAGAGDDDAAPAAVESVVFSDPDGGGVAATEGRPAADPDQEAWRAAESHGGPTGTGQEARRGGAPTGIEDSAAEAVLLPASSGGAAGFAMVDIQAAISAWLQKQGWSVFPHLYVNADLGDSGVGDPHAPLGDAAWSGDWFDGDPAAVIPLIAGSLAEIHLIAFGDLRNGRWRAAPWDAQRQGIASWRQETAKAEAPEDIPCPVSLAIRARERFLAQHGAYLSGAGYDSLSLINLVVVLGLGAVANVDDVVASWNVTDLSVVWLEPTEDGRMDPLPLTRVFGAPPEEELDPFVIKHLKEGSRAAMKLAGAAAA